MASLWHCGCAAPTRPLKLMSTVFSRPQIATEFLHKNLPASFSFRNEAVLRLRIAQRRFAVSASNNGGGSTEEKSAVTKTSDAAQSPPFLTILAGLLLLFIIIWIVGSITSWLISLIINLFPK